MNTSYVDHFQRIPENILVAIFELAVGKSSTAFPLQLFNNILCTILLVCRRWNLTAIHTPSIWVSVNFEHEAVSTPPQMTATALRQFSVFLRRSRSKPLNITFSTTSLGWKFSDVNTALALCYSRIQSLTCMLSSTHDMDMFLSVPRGNFPKLRYANINISSTALATARTSTQSRSATVFEGATSLQTALLHRIHGLSHVELRLHWKELKHIDFGGTSMLPNTFIEILRYTSRTLQTAFIFVSLEGPLNTILMAPNTLPLPKLTTLRLRLQYPHRNWGVLSLLHVPNLISFRLDMFDNVQHWSIAHVARFLRPSSESLKQLHLGDFEPSGHRLVRTHQQTSHTVLSDLFNITQKIKTLRLPLSMPVHATTIENIASGKILKYMSIMELSYANIWHGLDLARRRGNLARMAHSGHGCSAAEEPAVSGLDSFSLWIPSHQCNMEDIFDINTERRRLVSEGLIGHIHIRPTADLPLPISRRV